MLIISYLINRLFAIVVETLQKTKSNVISLSFYVLSCIIPLQNDTSSQCSLFFGITYELWEFTEKCAKTRITSNNKLRLDRSVDRNIVPLTDRHPSTMHPFGGGVGRGRVWRSQPWTESNQLAKPWLCDTINSDPDYWNGVSSLPKKNDPESDPYSDGIRWMNAKTELQSQSKSYLSYSGIRRIGDPEPNQTPKRSSVAASNPKVPNAMERQESVKVISIPQSVENLTTITTEVIIHPPPSTIDRKKTARLEEVMSHPLPVPIKRQMGWNRDPILDLYVCVTSTRESVETSFLCVDSSELSDSH